MLLRSIFLCMLLCLLTQFLCINHFCLRRVFFTLVDLLYCLLWNSYSHFRNCFYIVIILIIFKLQGFAFAVIYCKEYNFQNQSGHYRYNCPYEQCCCRSLYTQYRTACCCHDQIRQCPSHACGFPRMCHRCTTNGIYQYDTDYAGDHHQPHFFAGNCLFGKFDHIIHKAAALCSLNCRC